MNKTLVTLVEFGIVLLVLLLLIPELIHLGTTFYTTITDATPPPPPVETVVTGEPPPPALLADTPGNQTEDNALAQAIVHDLADQVYLGRHPGSPLPVMTIHPDVDTSASSSSTGKTLVNVTMIDWTDGSFSEIYQPAYAWDPVGYAPLAVQFLGGTAADPTVDLEGIHLLHDLADLTGPELARQDKRLSALLQKNPLNSGEQEEAALLLTALAWRENAGDYSDTRTLLNRAAAHLALAQALRGTVPATWNGRIAEALLLGLAGREKDAEQKVEALSTLQDGPVSAQDWVQALRLWLKENAQLVPVNESSSLILKLAWWQSLTRCVGDTVAEARLNAFPHREKVPDWGRAILSTPGGCSVKNRHLFGESTRTLEFQELNECLKVEGRPELHDYDLADDFAEAEPESVSMDEKGQAEYQVIGAGTFKAVTRRHLFMELSATEKWLRKNCHEFDQADFFIARMNILFRSVPYYKLVDADYVPHQEMSGARLAQQMREDQEVWEVSTLPPGLAFRQFPDKASSLLLTSFYRKIVPFGTAYQAVNRMEALDRVTGLLTKYPEETQKLQPEIPTVSAFLEKQGQLHPSCFALTEKQIFYQAENFPDHRLPPDQELALLTPFRDHNLGAVNQIYETLFNQLSDPEKKQLLTQRAALDPTLASPPGGSPESIGSNVSAAPERLNDQPAINPPAR